MITKRVAQPLLFFKGSLEKSNARGLFERLIIWLNHFLRIYQLRNYYSFKIPKNQNYLAASKLSAINFYLFLKF